MKKREELKDPASCLNRAHDDELLFVILDRDLAAAHTIRCWVEERVRIGKNQREDRQIAEALALAAAIEQRQVVANRFRQNFRA